MSDSIGQVEAVFQADTRSFDASVSGTGKQLEAAAVQAEAAAEKIEQVGATIDRTAQLQERAVERARKAWQLELQAQDRRIAKEKEVARAKELAALQADILSRSTANLTESVSHGVPAMSAASGALRLMEGNVTNNIRAAERFLGTTLGLAPVLEAAFPVVGALAFAGVIYEVGKKVYDFVSEVREVPKALDDGFADLRQKSMLATDQLSLENDQLQQQIDKLEGKRVNTLAAELDQARIMADKLVESLKADNKATEDLISKYHVSFGGTMLGYASTNDMEKMIQAQNKAQKDLAESYQDRIASAKTLGEIESIEAEKRVKMTSLEKAQVEDLVKLRDRYKGDAASKNDPYYASTNFGPLISMIQGQIDMRNSEMAHNNAQDKHEDNQREVKQLEARKEAARAAAEASRAAAEAARKASSLQMAGFEQDLAALRNDHAVGIEEERSFWLRKIDAVKLGSENYNKIFTKLGEENQQIIRKQAEAARKDGDLVAGIEQQEQARYEREMRDRLKLMQKSLGNSLEDQKLSRQNASEGYRGVFESTADAVQSGQMSPAARIQALRQALSAEVQAKQESYDADVALQTQALDDYKQLLGEGSDAYQQMLEDGSKHLKEILLERRKMQADADKQMADLSRQSMELGWRSAIDDMIRRSADLQGQLKSTLEGAVNSANDTIAKMMTGDYRRGDWTQTGKQIFSGMAKTGLQDSEGFLLKGLGIGGVGKLGTQSNPMWTRSADTIPGGMAGNGIPNLLQGLGGLSGKGDGGVGFGSFFGSLLTSFIPMADGGPTSPGHYLVGEHGPELLRLGSSGFIHNNKDTRQMFSGGDTHNHNYDIDVDARGATDPASVKRMVQQGIAEAAPHIAAQTIAAQRDMRSRMPSMRSS